MREMKIQYVPIGGSIGIISIGAGVAVAIMDWLRLEGVEAAAFVDIDYAIIDGRTSDALTFMVDWFSKDDSVNAILFNFVTCGHRLDEIAQHLVAVLGDNSRTRSKPIVLNLQGNRSEKAHGILKDGGFRPSTTLGDAVREVAKLARAGAR
jgi:succinyl-CoA synthetase beta subunit